MSDDLRHIATEVFLSIPPAVRTGVFIDVFTPCDWHHAARCMVDYAGILDDPREPFAPACDMPVICTTAVTGKTVVSDVRPLAYLPDDASVYRLVVDMEMDCVEVDVEKDGIVYVEKPSRHHRTGVRRPRRRPERRRKRIGEVRPMRFVGCGPPVRIPAFRTDPAASRLGKEPDLETRGVRVRFSSPAHENRYWWTIRECDGRYVVCVRERLALPDGLLAYTVADRRNGTRGHVKDERSGVKGACRPSDAAWLLEQAKAQGITDAEPLCVAEYKEKHSRMVSGW